LWWQNNFITTNLKFSNTNGSLFAKRLPFVLLQIAAWMAAIVLWMYTHSGVDDGNSFMDVHQ
jgi:hypothetical protein